jgi:hypothetical protein
MCPIAGGNWSNGSNAGPWALNLNNTRGNSNNNVGLRADSALPRTPQGDGGAKGGAFRPWAKSACQRLSSRGFPALDRQAMDSFR